MKIKDGLYRIVTSYCVAGFVVKDGTISKRAPILKKWSQSDLLRQGEWICKSDLQPMAP